MKDIEDFANAKTNLAEIFDDRYLDAIVENPYYSIDKEISASMNKHLEIGKISSPVHQNSSKIDMNLLRLYTNDILSELKISIDCFDIINKRISRRYHTMFKKTDIYYMYNIICNEQGIKQSDKIRGMLQTKSFRSQSGVMVYAVFTHPFYKLSENGKLNTFSCKYNCRFCPNMPGRPRSYVPGEPGNDRAHSLNYDVIKQVHVRANAYSANGHINDKAEVIVLGGTWHSYPLEYRKMFITLLYNAFNTIYEDRERPIKSMEEEIKLNEISKCRIIGLTIETRPDQIDVSELIELRKMGVTRVQLGIQHTDDRILTRIQRRCTSKDGINAIKSLKDCGFKVDIHVMPDLPKPFTKEFETNNKLKLNSANLEFTKADIDWTYDSIESDKIMFNKILHSNDYKPDQIKIYPCEVMDWTDIKKDFENGTHIPYGTITENQSTNELIELLIQVKSNFPEECRINRLIRDIPDSYVLGGIKDSSGRQRIENIMKERNLFCKCMRCREIKKKKIDYNDVSLKISHFKASEGDEYFLQYVTSLNELVGFLRLRLSNDSGYHIKYRKDGTILKKTKVFDELSDVAMIRELHIYGEAVTVNRETDIKNIKERTQQHFGFGTRLLQNAFILAKHLGYKKMSVISGEGVKPYYRRFNFYDGNYFLIKNLENEDINKYKAEPSILNIINKNKHKINYNMYFIFILVILLLIISILFYNIY